MYYTYADEISIVSAYLPQCTAFGPAGYSCLINRHKENKEVIIFHLWFPFMESHTAGVSDQYTAVLTALYAVLSQYTQLFDIRGAFAIIRSSSSILRGAFAIIRSAFTITRGAFTIIPGVFAIIRSGSSIILGASNIIRGPFNIISIFFPCI
jgi:hypothetical protein